MPRVSLKKNLLKKKIKIQSPCGSEGSRDGKGMVKGGGGVTNRGLYLDWKFNSKIQFK